MSHCGLTGLDGLNALPSLKELYAAFNQIENLEPIAGKHRTFDCLNRLSNGVMQTHCLRDSCFWRCTFWSISALLFTRQLQCNAMQCNAMQCNAMQCNAMPCQGCIVMQTWRHLKCWIWRGTRWTTWGLCSISAGVLSWLCLPWLITLLLQTLLTRPR